MRLTMDRDTSKHDLTHRIKHAAAFRNMIVLKLGL